MEDQLWKLFEDTGDPVCYLLYRQAKEEPEQDDDGG